MIFCSGPYYLFAYDNGLFRSFCLALSPCLPGNANSEGPFNRCSSRHTNVPGSLLILFTRALFITANKSGKMQKGLLLQSLLWLYTWLPVSHAVIAHICQVLTMSQHFFKCFTCVSQFNSHNNLLRQVLTPSYGGGKSGTEELSNWPKVKSW